MDYSQFLYMPQELGLLVVFLLVFLFGILACVFVRHFCPSPLSVVTASADCRAVWHLHGVQLFHDGAWHGVQRYV